MKIALVHDWLVSKRGGELVLDAVAELFPEAELFTLLHFPAGQAQLSPPLSLLKIHTSLLQGIPGIQRFYRYFFPVMPYFIERFDLTAFDLIISSSHCVAKGVKKAPHAVHVSYVHAPMRYIWDRFEDYFGPGRSSRLVRALALAVRGPLQRWDRKVSGVERIDQLLANSHFIQTQIQAAYQRDSQVIYPFAALERFAGPRRPGPRYLIVSAFAPYKKIDLAIQAFNQLALPLDIVGSGQDQARLQKLAGPSVRFLGACSQLAISELYATCRAFVFPGVEDFGITAIEALAAGTPVIAFHQGGVAESVTPSTGLFFTQPTPESLMAAVQTFEVKYADFQAADCRSRSLYFSKKRFQTELIQAVNNTLRRRGKTPLLAT